MSAKIKSLQAIQVLDSRGNPTISCRAELSDGSVGSASVPSGASTGEFEAIELRDGDKNVYRGKGVTKALGNLNGEIAEALVGLDACDQTKIDQLMIELDGTNNKARLGANAILGASLAVAHAGAKSCGQELYQYLGKLSGNDANVLPVPMVNVINGGAHANNSLDIQEFMLVPHGAPTFSEAIRYATEVFHKLGSLLKADGYETGVGDEGGYAPRLKSMDEAFSYLIKAIEASGYKPGKDISLALDVASSEFNNKGDGGSYVYHLVKSSGEKLSAEELVAKYENWLKTYPIVSIEDGLDENDWQGWKMLTERLGAKMQLVGDDLFVTNTERIARGIKEGIANATLIKLNQIGTLTETLSSIQMGVEAGYKNVISHRSGETADTTISDLAVGTCAGQIKTGSMCRGERTEKYNRLLWIENILGSKGTYAGF